MTRAAFDILTNPRNARVVAYFALACAASRAHSELARACYADYRDKGPLISGCEPEHFPERYKDPLTAHARACGDYCDKARAARPTRMHMATVNRIARLVATRDGAGRYGPQPIREAGK